MWHGWRRPAGSVAPNGRESLSPDRSVDSLDAILTAKLEAKVHCTFVLARYSDFDVRGFRRLLTGCISNDIYRGLTRLRFAARKKLC